tara:strand:- start:16334 stop:17254 length:921 start_codon:yes stop_codon:yes gene_type:complete
MVEFIMYHYVRDIKNSLFPNIKGLDIKEFKFQINYLKKNYNIISLEDFFNNDFNQNQKNCVLTFDDGYIDHYNFVLEVLLKNNIKGAFFPPVDVVDKNTLLDVNKIHVILASAEEQTIFKRLKYHFNKRNMSGKKLDYYINSIDTADRYDNKITVIIKRLLQTKLDYELRSKLCDDLLTDFSDFSIDYLKEVFYLNFDQLIEMKDMGMHIGSHGKSHYWFDSLSKLDQEKEIVESKFFLKNIYQNESFLLSMCFPYGNYNNSTLSLIKKHDFKIGLTTKPNKFNDLKDNLLEIPRLDTNDYPKFNL